MKNQKTWAKKYIKAKPRAMRRVVMCFGAETNSPRMIDGYVGVLNGDVVTHSGVLWESRKRAIEDAVKFREKCRIIYAGECLK